jgi:hypothetical protein
VSERVIKILDLRTGDVSEQWTETTAEGIKERVEGLRASAREMMEDPIIQETMTFICDGCGARRPLTLEEFIHLPDMPDGWTTNERGEFCGDCA